MPDTYSYKARDRAGNQLNGTLVADNEAGIDDQGACDHGALQLPAAQLMGIASRQARG